MEEGAPEAHTTRGTQGTDKAKEHGVCRSGHAGQMRFRKEGQQAHQAAKKGVLGSCCERRVGGGM